jgi:endonuclease/exonuclease/phosphatase family metal-dependent hydrolase
MRDRIRIATLNLLYYPQGDRWRERRPLVEAQLRTLGPDIIGLQEVNRPIDQDHLLAASAGPGRDYQVFRASETVRPRYPRHWDAVAFLVAAGVGEILGHHVRRLTYLRVVQMLRLRRPSGRTVTCLNTHLIHGDGPSGQVARRNQVRAMLAWLDSLPISDVVTVVGDFNALPGEPAVELMRAAGFHSANRTATGGDPVTYPSGLVASWTDGHPEQCIDYIWIRGAADVVDARVAFDRPSLEDPGLYPSDHRGLVADLEISRGSGMTVAASATRPVRLL